MSTAPMVEPAKVRLARHALIKAIGRLEEAHARTLELEDQVTTCLDKEKEVRREFEEALGKAALVCVEADGKHFCRWKSHLTDTPVRLMYARGDEDKHFFEILPVCEECLPTHSFEPVRDVGGELFIIKDGSWVPASDSIFVMLYPEGRFLKELATKYQLPIYEEDEG